MSSILTTTYVGIMFFFIKKHLEIKFHGNIYYLNQIKKILNA